MIDGFAVGGLAGMTRMSDVMHTHQEYGRAACTNALGFRTR
jgi:hypothetical protein